MRRFLESITDGEPTWVWLSSAMRFGDLYHACGLAAAFRRRHGMRTPIRLVLNSPASAGVARLFADQFDEVITEPLPGSWEDLIETLRQMNGLDFGRNRPIVLQPHLNPETREMMGFANLNRMTWMPLYRRILHLGPDAEFSPPQLNPVSKLTAERFCFVNGIVPGRSAILFPYAQSFPVPAMGHFAALAERLTLEGWSVFTSVAGSETPVDGAPPLHIPFDILPDVVEYAGWAIAVRSGICDMLSPTRAKKTWIFRNALELPIWGLASLGLCRDADELPFDFDNRAPTDFCQRVLDSPQIPRPRMQGLSDCLRLHYAPPPALSFSEFQRHPSDLTKWVAALSTALERSGGYARIVDIPTRSSARWAAEIDRALSSVASQLSHVKFYACRDHGGSDALEPLDQGAVASGGYFAAAFWHSLVLISKDCPPLSTPQIPRVIESSKAASVGVEFELSDLMSRPDALCFIEGVAPLGTDGLQLVGDWHHPEPWGIWSCGALCQFRFTLDETKNEGFSVRIDCSAPLSTAFPAVDIEMRVNGVCLGSVRLDLSGSGLPVVVAVPVQTASATSTFLVELLISDVMSPQAQGSSEDNRELGLGVSRISIASLSGAF